MREPRRRFLIITEGKNTEPAYLNALKASFPDALIEIRIEAAAGVPMTIATKALNAKKANARARNSYEKNDEVWAVFDRDDHIRFEEAISLCEAHGVGVARSIPCFEIWLILHRIGYDKPDSRQSVQRYLATLCPEYDPNGAKQPDCHALIPQIEIAEQRA